MIVLDKDLGIPKPFGPQVEEVCCLETHVRSLLEPLGLCCTFVDDISAYHRFLGEVHCGTNVRRIGFTLLTTFIYNLRACSIASVVSGSL